MLLLSLAPILTNAAAATKINNISIESNEKNTQIEINLSQETKYHYFSLQNPDRLVIDLDNTQEASTSLPNLSKTPWIKKIRAASHTSDQQRIVLEFTQTIKSNLILSPPSANNTHWRLSINLQTPLNSHSTITDTEKTSPQAVTQVTNKQPPSSKTADVHFAKSHCVTIVIDPGHGGHDPGAVGLNGTKEKNVTLAISEYLADLINHSSGMCAYLTRTKDEFVTLRGRLSFARKKSADLFIAIHADMFKNKEAKGATVFALSQRGATSEAARWIAHNENVSDLLEIGTSDGKDKDLQSILMDISQNETINRSLIFGKDVLLNLDNVSKLHHTIVEQAGFVVLKSPDIPSILVETGFLSNAYEESQLSQNTYQKKIALAIYRGIMEYSSQYSFLITEKKIK